MSYQLKTKYALRFEDTKSLQKKRFAKLFIVARMLYITKLRNFIIDFGV